MRARIEGSERVNLSASRPAERRRLALLEPVSRQPLLDDNPAVSLLDGVNDAAAPPPGGAALRTVIRAPREGTLGVAQVMVVTYGHRSTSDRTQLHCLDPTEDLS